MSDIDDLEDVEALFEREKSPYQLVRNGVRASAPKVARSQARGAAREKYLRKFGKGTKRKAPPITLAGPRS